MISLRVDTTLIGKKRVLLMMEQGGRLIVWSSKLGTDYGYLRESAKYQLEEKVAVSLCMNKLSESLMITIINLG